MGQDHPSNRLGFQEQDLETECRVHLLVSKYPGREKGEEGARLAGEGGQSAMQAGQPRKPGGRWHVAVTWLGSYNQSLDTGCPGEWLCNKGCPQVGGQGRQNMVLSRSWAACSLEGACGASLCPSAQLILLSSAGPGFRREIFTVELIFTIVMIGKMRSTENHFITWKYVHFIYSIFIYKYASRTYEVPNTSYRYLNEKSSYKIVCTIQHFF